LSIAAQPGSQFIQLQVREPEMAEEALGSGRVQPTGSRRQHHSDLVRGGFQTGQGSVASSTESGATGRTSKGLDSLGMAMLAIPNKTGGCEHL